MKKLLLSIVFISFFYSQATAQSIRINELMARNSSILQDEDGDFSDWIELYNEGPDNQFLENWILTDEAGISKWTFPAVTINAGEYLILFASDKNRSVADAELHTNFKLSGGGEYLGLVADDQSVISEFSPAFPEQFDDISYSYDGGTYVYSITATPNLANTILAPDFVPAPSFSVAHGFFNQSFFLDISGSATIYYTTDGSEPSETNGTLFTASIEINTTSIVRAVSMDDGVASKIVTATYIFPADVINQPNNPAGYPTEWGPYYEFSGNAIADYEMDPEITQDPRYADQMNESLLALPVLSIVTDKDNLFSSDTDPDKGGIYYYTGPADTGGSELGGGWERSASVEYFDSEGSEGFQINCGLRLHGGHSRRVEKTPKHSFRLAFREEYGSSRLKYPLFDDGSTESFNTLVLRAGYGNSLLHSNHSERSKIQMIRDIWAKQTQRDMGHPFAHGKFVHLYLNGMYWGIYNPTERIDKDFSKLYFDGEEEDFDIIKDYSEVADGNIDAWNTMIDLANDGVETNEAYEQIIGTSSPAYVDAVSLIDYLIINYYGANWDWDHHNWVAVRNRANPGTGFQFFSWDAEHIIEDINANNLNEFNQGTPTNIFRQLKENPTFARLFADRVQMHFFGNGVLTPENAIERWMDNASELETAIIAETARWGDYRRDVHSWRPGQTFDLYDKEYWDNELDYIIKDYFPQRGAVFIQQLKNQGLFPDTDAPQFLIDDSPIAGQFVDLGTELEITSDEGTIFFTTDGSDPFDSSSSIEYSNSISITENVLIKARVLSGGEWSPIVEQELFLSSPIGKLKITEIHYHPLDEVNNDDGEYEFIELKNTSDAALSLDHVEFTNGIQYQFPMGATIEPSAFVVLASNANAFENRYGFAPFGQYEGSLNNGGEKLSYSGDFEEETYSIKYDDDSGWPALPDGLGYSLVPLAVNPQGNQNREDLWRNSFSIHGSPGANDVDLPTTPSVFDYLKITEIHYHPLSSGQTDEDALEFIELKNIGDSDINLNGIAFADGITYSFTDDTILKPASFLVLASNAVEFLERYEFDSYDQYDGTLSNGGERLVVTYNDNVVHVSIDYDTKDPWPETPDGGGNSLVPIEINPSKDQSRADQWRASLAIHGSPGADDESSATVLTGIEIVANNLISIHPNPIKEYAVIKYSLTNSGQVSVIVFDLFGKSIQTLTDRMHSAGDYELLFDTTGLQDGLYIIQSTANNQDIQRKKVLLYRK